MIKKTIILIFISSVLFANVEHDIDSLKNTIKQTTVDSIKIKALNKLAEKYIDIDKDSAFIYVEQALDYSIKKNNIKGKIQSYKEYGIIYFYKSDFENARKNFNKALQLAIDIKDKYLEANIYYLIGATYYHNDNYERALKEYKIALSIARNNNFKDTEANCYNAIGILHRIQGNYEGAIENYLNALKLAEEEKNNEVISNLYNNLGVLYKNHELYDKALEYYNKSLKIIELNDDKQVLMNLYNNIGIIYKYKKEYNKSLEYFNKSLNIAKEIDSKDGIFSSYNNMGNLYKSQKKYKKAIETYNKALSVNNKNNQIEGAVNTYQNIGDLYLIYSDTLKKKSERIEYLNSAIRHSKYAYNIANKINDFSLKKNSAYTLMNAYKKLGNNNKSLEYALIYIELNQKIYDIDKLKTINELEKKYNTEKDKILIEKLQKEQDLRNQKIKTEQLNKLIKDRQVKLLVISIILLILFLLYVSRNLLKNKKLNKELNKLNKEIDNKSQAIKKQYLESVKQNIELNTKTLEIEKQKQEIINRHKEIKELDDDYKSILDSNTDIVFIIDAEGKILFLNNRSQILLGYTREEILGESFMKFVPENEITGYLNKLQESFKNQEINSYESFMRHKNGMHIPVEISGQIIKYKGQIVGAGTIRDITERKIAEQKLKDKTQKYELISNAIDDLIWLIDFNLNFIYVNSSSEEKIGYSEKELAKIPAYHIFTKESLQILRRKIAEARVYKNKKVTAELEYIHKNGQTVKANIIGHIVVDEDRIIGFAAVSRFLNKKT